MDCVSRRVYHIYRIEEKQDVMFLVRFCIGIA